MRNTRQRTRKKESSRKTNTTEKDHGVGARQRKSTKRRRETGPEVDPPKGNLLFFMLIQN